MPYENGIVYFEMKMVFCIVFSPQTGWIWCQPRQSWSYNIGVKTEKAEKSERKKYKVDSGLSEQI